MPAHTDGFITYEGRKIYYEIFGDLRDGTPLLGLHGGPGYPHYHLEPLAALAEQGIPVVLYDQLGCGKSDRPDNPKLWKVQYFVEELSAVRMALKLDTINLLGHSWGGSLAAEYMLTKPHGVEKLILSSPLLDSKLWVAEADRLKDKMFPGKADIMRRHEADGTTDSAEYAQVYDEFVSLFVCRVKPYPEQMKQADAEMGFDVYQAMWGPSEAFATGNLKNWSVLKKLKKIKTPTLLIAGRHDEATPLQMDRAHEKMPHASRVTLEHSSHSGLFEEPDAYLAAVSKFLAD